MKKITSLLSLLLAVVLVLSSFTACSNTAAEEAITEQSSTTTKVITSSSEKDDVTQPELPVTEEKSENETKPPKSEIKLSDIPEYSGKPYIALNGNTPVFSKNELKSKGYESYSKLDSLGRCGIVIASLGKDTMPKDGEKRGSISDVKPSGWVQAQYDFISGKYLYNRCHLIGWQLSAENANRRNLITGTKYFNINGMLPFENMVADYIHETGNHVAYRVTPMYNGSDLVATGVQIEAYSVEDDGDGISFNVFCYNVQPDVKIDYSTGKSYSTASEKETTTKKANATKKETTTKKQTPTENKNQVGSKYILNTNSKKIHYAGCRHVKSMKESNKEMYTGNINDLFSQGYTTCGTCF